MLDAEAARLARWKVCARRPGRDPGQIDRVRLEDGRRELFRTIVPPDLVGVLNLFGFSVSEDEASNVYGIWVRRGQAYLVDGAR